ncbi:DUF202 domain-containing protein [Arthrobacter terrae]|uniref:DUF202 domain-containing protein n=1 Tax=Arthrobacter terrae TaxID=2935737 RepID=UPI001E5FD74C|nr:DUF202 domain-containing protein [Arthrobacter terrae]
MTGQPDAAGPAAPRDPGLQPERTSLAWRRTVLSMLVADVFIWRGWLVSLGADSESGTSGLSAQSLGLGLCATTAAGTTAVLIICALVRLRVLHGRGPGVPGGPGGPGGPGAAVLRAAAASVVALAVAAAAAIFLV